MPSLYRLLGLGPPFDATRFTTSYLLPPVVLASCRLLIGLYAIVTNVSKLIIDNTPHSREQHWSYFTNITYWSLGFYFLFAAYHTFVYNAKGVAPLQTWYRPLQAAHLVLWTTVVIFPLLVTAVYWGILAPTDSPFRSVYSGWSNVSLPWLWSAKLQLPSLHLHLSPANPLRFPPTPSTPSFPSSNSFLAVVHHPHGSTSFLSSSS